MSANESDEQDLINLYRQFRQSPVGKDNNVDMTSAAAVNASSDVASQSIETSELSQKEHAIVSSYRTYKRDRDVTTENDQLLVASIVERCAPILDRSEAEVKIESETSQPESPKASLSDLGSHWWRNIFDYLSAPSGALVATAVVASLVLYPLLNNNPDELTVFAGSEVFEEGFALSSLNAHLDESLTRSSSLPGRSDSVAYHYNIGRLVAGLAVAIRGKNQQNGAATAKQLLNLTASDPNIDTDRIMQISKLWIPVNETESDHQEDELKKQLGLFIDKLNTRRLSSVEKSYEHLGAWTMGSRLVVRATVENANVENGLLKLFIKEFPELKQEIMQSTNLLVKHRRSLEAFELAVVNFGKQLPESSRSHLLAVSEKLDNIHIAFKN